MPPYKPLQIRLQQYVVNETTGCHLWTGLTNERGYGVMNINRKPRRAHRIAYEQYVGIIPEGKVVRHLCHTPRCINPSHLAIGTQKDNIDDSVRDGRTVRGEQQHNAKLTEGDVRYIKELLEAGHKHKTIARMFNINMSIVSLIKCHKAWKHVQ